MNNNNNNNKFNFTKKKSIDRKDESFKEKRINTNTSKSRMSSNDRLVGVVDGNKEEMKNNYMKSLPSLKKFGDNDKRK